MGIRSGLGGQIGLAPETTYGTYVPLTKFIEGTAKLKDTSAYIVGGGVAAGRMQKLGARRVKTLFGAEGAFECEVTNKGMGTLLQALMGTTVTPVQQAATIAYLQTHTLADPFGKFFSFQEGLPDISAGTPRPHTFLGCKVLSAEFKCAIGEILTSTWDINARELVETETLGAASYSTTVAPFNWTQLTVKIGATVGAAASVDGIRGVSVKVDRKSATDRNYAGTGGKQKEPVINDWQEITGSLDSDYVDKAILADRYHAGTGFALILEWVGPVIASTYFETFRITLPQCFLTGDTPELAGPELVSGSFPFETQFDGTTQPKIEYISTDVTL